MLITWVLRAAGNEIAIQSLGRVLLAHGLERSNRDVACSHACALPAACGEVALSVVRKLTQSSSNDWCLHLPDDPLGTLHSLDNYLTLSIDIEPVYAPCCSFASCRLT